jgi:hypothetical protein
MICFNKEYLLIHLLEFTLSKMRYLEAEESIIYQLCQHTPVLSRLLVVVTVTHAEQHFQGSD